MKRLKRKKVERILKIERKIHNQQTNAYVNRIKELENELKYWKERFRQIGSNVETLDVPDGKYVTMLKWELHPQIYGEYIGFDSRIFKWKDPESIYRMLKNEVVEQLVSDLVEKNLVQFIVKEPNQMGPFDKGTCAAKLYVVPWEQMALRSVYNRKTIELIKAEEKDGYTNENGDDHPEGRAVSGGTDPVQPGSEMERQPVGRMADEDPGGGQERAGQNRRGDLPV